MSAQAPQYETPHVSTQPLPGQLLDGKYRLEERIGVGGMGAVHLATHVLLKQRVAIKFLHADALQDAASVERFQREAHAAVRLRSEHVARVLDLGRLPSGAPYTVMEFLQGADLAQVLAQRGRLPFQEAIEYVLQACEAVAEAHAAGIVHRDLKPSNLFLTHRVDGRPLVKVLDFGISKLSADLQQGGGADAQLTRTSAIIGSPSYMSPEQLRSSRDVDARADIWSLGVIMYELMAHYLPFAGESLTELTLRIAGDPTPSLRALVPEVPEAIENAVRRCLEKNRDARYASVIDLIRDIETFADPLTVSMAERLGRAMPSTPPNGVGAVRGGSSAQLTPLSPMASPFGGALPPLPPHVITPRYGTKPVPSSTGVAWTDTEMMAPQHTLAPAPNRRSWVGPLFAIMLAGSIVGVGAGIKYGRSTPPAAPHPPESQLPPERKDLPPMLPTANPAPTAQLPASALPSGRLPIAEPPSTAKSVVAAPTPARVNPAPANPGPANSVRPRNDALPDERK